MDVAGTLSGAALGSLAATSSAGLGDEKGNCESLWLNENLPTSTFSTATGKRYGARRLFKGEASHTASEIDPCCTLLSLPGYGYLARPSPRTCRHAGSRSCLHFRRITHFSAGGADGVLSDVTAAHCVGIEHRRAVRGHPTVAPLGERQDHGHQFTPLVGE